jgi:hypothetical protein
MALIAPRHLDPNTLCVGEAYLSELEDLMPSE